MRILLTKGVSDMSIEELVPLQKLDMLILLYRGAIEDMTNAEDFLKKGDLQEKANALERAENIVLELNAAINVETGGEVASNIARLYDFVLYNITMGNIKNDAQAIINGRNVLNTLLEGWEEARKGLEKQANV